MSPAASARQPRPDQRRGQLLEATRRVIQRSGFASATVGEITREAGASLGLLHYHFASKDDVVAEAFADVARRDLAELAEISRLHDDPAERLAAYLDLSGWADAESWGLWVDAWGESVHTAALRETLGRFVAGWRRVLADVLADGARRGAWACPDPEDTAARLVAVIDGIGLHGTLHGEDVPPERASAWARRLAELELGITLPPPPAEPSAPRPRAREHELRLSIRGRDLDARGHVDPAVLVGYLQEGRTAWLRAALPGAEVEVTHVEVAFERPLGRDDSEAVVRCGLDAGHRSGLRTSETVEAPGGLRAARATATLRLLDAETARPRAATDAERAALEGR